MPRTLYATLIGIDAYQRPVPALNGCVNDVDAIALLLQQFGKTGGFAIDLLVLKDSQATRSNVIGSFRDHLAKAGPDDVATLRRADAGQYSALQKAMQSQLFAASVPTSLYSAYAFSG